MNEDTKILTLYSNEQDFIKDFGVKTTKKTWSFKYGKQLQHAELLYPLIPTFNVENRILVVEFKTKVRIELRLPYNMSESLTTYDGNSQEMLI